MLFCVVRNCFDHGKAPVIFIQCAKPVIPCCGRFFAMWVIQKKEVTMKKMMMLVLGLFMGHVCGFFRQR